MKQFLTYFILLISLSSFGQHLIHFNGQIIDDIEETGIDKVKIVINNTTFYTDPFGFYNFRFPADQKDSIYFTKDGYWDKTLKIKDLPSDGKIILEQALYELSSVKVYRYENPAFKIMREVIKHKSKNDIKQRPFYIYKNYNKTYVEITDINPKFKKTKLIKSIIAKSNELNNQHKDSAFQIPVFFSENFSEVFQNNKLMRYREELNAYNNQHLGFSGGKIIKPLMSSTYLDINFYDNRITIIDKSFLSPIADSWQLFYKYKLVDSNWIDNSFCYKIEFVPKNSLDLAFSGSMWIAKDSWAVKQIKTYSDGQLNLNFLKNVQLEQIFNDSTNTPWFLNQYKYTFELNNISHYNLGLKISIDSYHSENDTLSEFDNNRLREPLYEREDAYFKGLSIANYRRHNLSTNDSSFIRSVNAIKNIPKVKFLVYSTNLLAKGYIKTGPVDIGNYLTLINYNNIEGIRNTITFKSNTDFSKIIKFYGYIGYGYDDNRFKYAINPELILSRKRWSITGFEYRYDIDQFGINPDLFANNQIFYSFSRNGTIRAPYDHYTFKHYWQTDITKSITTSIQYRYQFIKPKFDFEWINNNNQISNHITCSEIIIDHRWAKDEYRFINGNDRDSWGAKKWPILNFRSTIGLKDFLESNINYVKLSLIVNDNFNIGQLGKSYYTLIGGKYFGNTPFPLLETHIGNESLFYSTIAFQQMNYFEFISDEFISLNYRHYFNGFLFNRLPIVKKLKWGFIATTNMIWGQLSNKNLLITPQYTSSGYNQLQFNSFQNHVPYLEVGYGIERILKYLRVDFIHRLNYLSLPEVRKFGVKFSFQLSL